MRGMEVDRSFPICDPLSRECHWSKHLSLSPNKYFFSGICFHQSFFLDTRFQRIFAPIAKLERPRSLTLRPSFSLGCFTISHFIRWNLVVSSFPPSQRKHCRILDIEDLTFYGERREENRKMGRVERIDFISTVWSTKLSQKISPMIQFVFELV
jgi:hypothetical protein